YWRCAYGSELRADRRLRHSAGAHALRAQVRRATDNPKPPAYVLDLLSGDLGKSAADSSGRPDQGGSWRLGFDGARDRRVVGVREDGVFLGCEMAEERHLAHAGRVGDLGNRRVLKALRVEQVDRARGEPRVSAFPSRGAHGTKC